MITSNLREKLKSERGATSVLVIFMMLVLVTLGAFAIVSANANYKFSVRALDWNKMYYDLDAQAEEFLSVLDGKLALAEDKACKYMLLGSFKETNAEEIPEDLQAEIYMKYQENGLNGKFGAELYSQVYLYYADIYVNELTLVYPDSIIRSFENNGSTNGFLTSMTFKSEHKGNEDCCLVISVRTNAMEYIVKDSGGDLSITKASDNLRYTIESWYEYQVPKSSESRIEVWDGKLQ